MAKSKPFKSLSGGMLTRASSILTLTDEFCHEFLNDDFAQLVQKATYLLCQRHPSLISGGQMDSWAAGIVHAIGSINFIFDPSQTPHVPAAQLYKWFSVSSATGQNKSKLVRELLKMHQATADWCVPQRLDQDPLFWVISMDDIVLDVRDASRDIQSEAFFKGLVPYIPGEKDKNKAIAALANDPCAVNPLQPIKLTHRKALQPPSKLVASPEALRSLYILDVTLFSSPLLESPMQDDSPIKRVIEIRGDQMLSDLHQAIFQAFDREDDKPYEFQLKGRSPNDPNAYRYRPGTPPADVAIQQLDDDALRQMGDALGDMILGNPIAEIPPDGDAGTTQLGVFNLEVDELFGYWFDPEALWWHQVQVLDIKAPWPGITYPRLTRRVGGSPAQNPIVKPPKSRGKAKAEAAAPADGT
jgi:hypothetical protein